MIAPTPATPVPARLRALVVLACVAAGAVLLGLWDPEAARPPWTCPFRWATGLPCALCGLTRALHHLLHLEWPRAWHLNPLAFPAAAFGLWLAARAAWELASGRRVRPLPVVRGAGVALLATLFLLHWALHIRAAVVTPKPELLRPGAAPSEKCPAPAAVRIGPGPQLFVDDVLIARKSGVVRKAHACRKLPEPVLTSEMPWEGSAENKRIYIYGTVLRDPASGGFRMWYNRGNRVLLATSKDGVHWERPRLGLASFEGNKDNNILPIGFNDPSVILDERDPDPARRYKMLGCVSGRGYCVAHSADGLHWTEYPKNPIVQGGDTCTLAQDPTTGECLAFFKRTLSHRGQKRRLVYLTTSSDMQTWSKPELVMAPDEVDDRETQSEGGLFSQFYNMSAFPCGGQFLGLVTHFRHTSRRKETGPGQSPDDGPIDVQLVHSRDGRAWRRCEDRSPVIPNGPHAYDAGCILAVANLPVIAGDEMWFYYTAITTTHGGALPEKAISIARAAWRLEGFVSLDAGDGGGIVDTAPLLAPAGGLRVNADASRGELRVEVFDEAGRPLPGYARQDCVPIRSDDVRRPVRWDLHDRLPAGRPLRLRFHMRNTSLFSYVLGESP